MYLYLFTGLLNFKEISVVLPFLNIRTVENKMEQ